MEPAAIAFSVFTKPWKMPIAALGEFVQRLGFTQVELPVRPGYQVEPARVATDLAPATRVLRDLGIEVASIAGTIDEAMIAACADAGVPMIRLMAPISGGYLDAVDATRRALDRAVPLLEAHGVRLGVQNHYGRFVCNAMGLRDLIAGFDPRHVVAVWDAAHNALAGELPEHALDILGTHLGMVNLKNAVWARTNRQAAGPAEWEPVWTSGTDGLASWPRVAAELQRRGYRGTICLTAEYSDQSSLEHLVATDLAFAKSLFGAN
jgi:sugar phosphate isomerase/epimerase